MSEEMIWMLLHIGSAWAAGSVIGLEREYRGHPAGLRTHALVCVASALLMIAMQRQLDWLGDLPLQIVQTDPIRMAQAIMIGIGFLGAGVIFKEGAAIRGLTTAASVWVTAAVGILYGVGAWGPALAGTLVALTTLALFQKLEDRLPAARTTLQTLTFHAARAPREADLRRMLADHGFAVAEIGYAQIEDGAALEFRLLAKTRDANAVARLVHTLRQMDAVREFRIDARGD